jgi:hypothetical protein
MSCANHQSLGACNGGGATARRGCASQAAPQPVDAPNVARHSAAAPSEITHQRPNVAAAQHLRIQPAAWKIVPIEKLRRATIRIADLITTQFGTAS